MNRIATTLNAIAASAVLLHTGTAAEATVEQLSSRIIALESRIASLEKQVGEPKTGSYTYQDQATIDATNARISAPAPAPAPETKSAPAPRPSETYVIKDGDKISTIAEKFQIDRKELLAANRLSEGQPIYIGETLLIPGVEGQGAVADATKLAPAKEKSIVVGDTKAAPSNSSAHTVAKGDTLMALSRKYSTSVESIKSANGLRSDVITPGQKLTIPSQKSAPAAETTTQLASSTTTKTDGQNTTYQYDNELLKTSETYGYYTVRKGDNLYALGQDFFTNMAELQRLNRLGNSTLIHPGDDLIVPTSRYNAYHNKQGVASN